MCRFLAAALLVIAASAWMAPPLQAGPVRSGIEAPVHAQGATAYAARVHVDEAPAVGGGAIRLGEIARIETDDPDLRARIAGVELGAAALPGLAREVSWGT